MREKPILFSGPMVLAILEGRKTMTRRVRELSIPLKYEVGDLLWVRESIGRRPASFLGIEATNGAEEAFYVADGDPVLEQRGFNCCPWWSGKGGLTSIHMPRWASRITLRVTGVKVERLQDISEADAIAEGVPNSPQSAIDFSTGKFCPGFRYQDGSFSNLPGAYRRAWMELWNSINGPGAWEKNPWVAAYTFEIVSVSGRDGQ